MWIESTGLERPVQRLEKWIKFILIVLQFMQGCGLVKDRSKTNKNSPIELAILHRSMW